MALFSSNKYFKPGKGVEKDEPEKRSFFKFFELFGRKFWRYIEVNLIEFVVLLPVILFLMVTAYDYLFSKMAPEVVTDDLKTTEAIEETMQTYAGQTVFGQVLDYGNLESTDGEETGSGYVSLALGTLTQDDDAAALETSGEIVTFYLVTQEDLPIYNSEEGETTDLTSDLVLELTVTEDGASSSVSVHAEASAPLLSVESFNVSVWTLLMQISIWYYQNIPTVIRDILLLASVLAFGPCKAGITYVLRNFSQQQHAWLTDIWDKAKENWKQALPVGILDFLVLGLFVFNLSYNWGDGYSATMVMAMKYICVIVAFIYCIMRKYIYLMMVTVDLTFSALLKNAWLLTFLGSARNFAVTLGNGLIWGLVFAATYSVNHMVEFLLPLLLYSFTGFLNVSVCYPLVNKYLVVPIQEMQAKQAAENPQTALDAPEDEPKQEDLF